MSYRYEKNTNGQYDLVIDGFEKGIATSPVNGIGNIRNLNIKYYEGVAYMNYKRQTCTISGGTLGKPLYSTKSQTGLIYISDDNQQVWKQDSLNGSSFTRLTGNTAQNISGIQWWNNYLLVFGQDSGGVIDICGDGTGDSGINSSNWNTPLTSVTFTVTIATPAVFTANNHGLVAGQVLRLFTTGALPTGLTANTNYYVSSTGLTQNTFELATSYANAIAGTPVINTSGSQSGTQTYQAIQGGWPIRGNISGTFSSAPAAGATSATLSSIADGNNISRGVWPYPTGSYGFTITLVGSRTQTVIASCTYGSNAISWTPSLNFAADSSAGFTLVWNSATVSNGIQHQSVNTAFDGNSYFCNGSLVGAFIKTPNQVFSKSDSNTFSFYSNILPLPTTETATWLTELGSNLLILGKYKLYPWDFFSPFYQTPIPIDEQMVKGINILNNVYIFAGNKGDIYISNGFSISRLFRMSDYISGVVDPSWNVGGVMQHRQKLYFQMLVKNGQTGANIMAGIFSYDLDTGALNMENENSAGLNPSGMVSTGILIDDSDTSINYDKYYSAFGATASSIDYNDTTLYSNNEAVIETDIIPVGTFFQSRTFGSAEFKMDQPLQSGDSITLYARPSLSDSWTTVGTTTASVLSDGFTPIPFEKWQWLQFKITMSCNPTSTSSSFNRIREIRIR